MMKLKSTHMFLLCIAILGVSFSIGCPLPESDTVAPTVSSTVPVDSAAGVAVSGDITAAFSEAMNPLTITESTFILNQGTTPVIGTVAYDGTTATFNPVGNLASNTAYTATITTEAKDLAGNALAADKVWTFTTADGTAPTVSLTVPFNAATGVAVNSNITATFSEAMDQATIVAATFTLKQGTTLVTGTVTYAGTTATFNPGSDLEFSTTYTATITTGATDAAGNALAANKEWIFVTGVAPDTTPPAVSSVFPTDSATGVGVNINITATFSEAMHPATIVAASFTLNAGTTPVTGTVTYDLPNKTAIFAPLGNLAVGTTYTATITTGAMDLAGNALAGNEEWSFTTMAAAAAGPAPVSLGTAGNYVILAKTAVTNVPNSAITGDVGLSPAAESYYAGFSQTDATGYATSPQVTGFMYAADMAPPTPTSMTTAISDMETAYTDAAGRTLSVINDLGAGTLSGLTFAPGLYKWGSDVNITTNITIAGAANDVWIFQMSGNLVVSSAVNIVLSGGARAKNIFWQVAGYASLGTTCIFEGIILSQTQITMDTGATLNGRALAQTQVVLDQNTVTKPAQ